MVMGFILFERDCLSSDAPSKSGRRSTRLPRLKQMNLPSTNGRASLLKAAKAINYVWRKVERLSFYWDVE